MTIAQYLSKYFFEKYEDEEIFIVPQCALPVSTSMKPESVFEMVGGAKIMLTSLRIICNYTRYAFGKRNTLLEKEVHKLVTRFIEAEYRLYEYDKEKGVGKQHIKFCYIQVECILPSQALALTNE